MLAPKKKSVIVSFRKDSSVLTAARTAGADAVCEDLRAMKFFHTRDIECWRYMLSLEMVSLFQNSNHFESTVYNYSDTDKTVRYFKPMTMKYYYILPVIRKRDFTEF